jgi:hypothetical protein
VEASVSLDDGTDTKESLMTYQDPLNPIPPRPSEVDPLPTQPPGSNPPRYQDVDRTWNAGVIGAAILALLVVIGVIVWASTTPDQQTASNPPAQTTGTGGQNAK